MYRLKESFIHYIKAGLALCVLFLLNACHTDTRYHVYQAVSGEEGWDKSDSLAFHLPVGLSSGEYRMEIGLRHTGEYPYRDIAVGDAVGRRFITSSHGYTAHLSGR